MKNIDKSSTFLGFKFVSSQKREVLKQLLSQVENKKSLQTVFTPNPEQLVYALSHNEFAKVLGSADLLLPDGIGIVFASKLLAFFRKKEGETSISQRITGVDVVAFLLSKLGATAAIGATRATFGTATDGKPTTILLVGGRHYADLSYKHWKVQEYTQELAQKNSSVKKNGSTLYWTEGFLNVTQPTEAETKQVKSIVQELKPNVVFVALGAPYQEQWVAENRDVLEKSGASLVMVVGGAFDMLLGKVARAPKWMQKMGLEWLFRLYQEPWRWRRQLQLLVFVKLVLKALVGR